MNRKIIGILVVSAGIAASGFILVRAQSLTAVSRANENSVIFPVSELGGCTNRENCRTYCENPANIDSCVSFGKSHGLMDEEEASRALKFKSRLEGGNTPGSCKTPAECENFCQDISHIEECVKFAKETGVKKGDKIENAEKILLFIKSGGQMPGGCSSRQSCERYCGDFSHAKECFAFAQKAGIAQLEGESGGRGGEDMSVESIGKFIEMAQAGQTPGACKSKDECENYCRSSAHFEECMQFAEKAGFIKPGQAQKFRQLKGQGPGGCASEDSCQKFCNSPENRDQCYKFAKENGFIKEEDLKHIKDGLVNLRVGLSRASEETAACLKSSLGEDIMQKIQSGDLVPGPEMGEAIKSCFEKSGRGGSPSEIFSHMPEPVMACVKEKLGDLFVKIQSDPSAFAPEAADGVRACFQEFDLEHEKLERENSNAPGASAQFLRSAPAEVKECISHKGIDADDLKAEQLSGSDLKNQIKSCFERFRPRQFRQDGGANMPPGENRAGPRVPLPPGLGEAARNCLRENLGAEFSKFESGGQPTPEAEAAVGKCLQDFTPRPQASSTQTINGSLPAGPPSCDPSVPSCAAIIERFRQAPPEGVIPPEIFVPQPPSPTGAPPSPTTSGPTFINPETGQSAVFQGRLLSTFRPISQIITIFISIIKK